MSKFTLVVLVGIVAMIAGLAIPHTMEGKMSERTIGAVPHFTNNGYPSNPIMTALGVGALVIGAFVYIMGFFGPTPRKENAGGFPVDAALHESIFGTEYHGA